MVPRPQPLHEFPTITNDWHAILRSVAQTRETYIDRTRRGLFFLANPAGPNLTWSVLAFPITLHDRRPRRQSSPPASSTATPHLFA